MERLSLQRIDYTTMLDLARAANFQVVEARGLDTRKGIRFRKGGMDWIALDSDLPVHEKMRTLGHLMDHRMEDVASRFGKSWGSMCDGSSSCVFTLCC